MAAVAVPPAGSQRIIPYLAYHDAPGAVEFLCRAFGFTERFRVPMPDGRLGHVELGYRDNVLMLASQYEGFAQTPQQTGGFTAQIYCYVDDVDQHFAQARAAGATLVGEPVDDHGVRSYRAFDLEGHPWIFATPLAEGAG